MKDKIFTHTFNVSFDIHSKHHDPDEIDDRSLLTRMLLRATRLSRGTAYDREAFNHIKITEHELCSGGGCEMCDPSYHDHI